MKYPAVLSLLSLSAAIAAPPPSSSLPLLDMSGFSWAENLLITHTGLHMFVSDNTRGELYRISLSPSRDQYLRTAHISDQSIAKFGGLAQSADGQVIYAGVTYQDGSTAIISTPAEAKEGEYENFSRTKYQPNGLQVDLAHEVLYYTDTGSNSLMAVNYANSSAITEELVQTISSANGCWLDTTNELLYVGELLSKHVNVLSTSSSEASLVKTYEGMGSLSMKHMLDDITLLHSSDTSDMDHTMILGADYQGKAIQQFSLDGEKVSEVPVSSAVLSEGDLTQITSVRWGVGPNFDENSVYVSEGGGMVARDDSRRVFQVVMN